MVMYPDSIVLTVNNPATKDSYGNWIAGTETSYTFDCRISPNGSGKKIASDDGQLIDFSYSCYMHATETLIPFGTNFTVTSAKNGVITGDVKRQYNGQLNSRLWL